MTILSVVEEYKGRSHQWSSDASRKYQRQFLVLSDNLNDGPETIRIASGVPRIFDAYVAGNDIDLSSRVQSVDVQLAGENSPFLWRVTVDYSTLQRKIDTQFIENPLLRPSFIEWTYASYQRAIYQDRDGTALVNSAKEPFDPPIEIDDARPVLKITRNEASFNPARAFLYQNAINSDDFFGAGVEQALMHSITASQEQENSIYFWKVSYEVHFRITDSWALHVLDTGYYELNVDGTKSLIVDPKTSMPLSAPTLLDGVGKKLSASAAPTYLFFNVYKALPFSVFGLP